ncbi:MAG: T9SS type A sorting domain-containing protein [Desulfocucumaceae bacterium]
MKRLISLTALIICSFTISFGATQTWRLTNDGNGDTKPNIVADNQNHAWVQWLSNAQGNYDVCYQVYSGSWSARDWLTSDDVDQISCDITCNKVTGSIWAVWDSSGKVQYSEYSSGWYGSYNAADSLFPLPQYISPGRISIEVGDSGRKYLSWPAVVTDWYVSACIMHYDSLAWNQPECVLMGEGMSPFYEYNHYPIDMAIYKEQSAVLCYTLGGSMGGNWYRNLSANCPLSDTSWKYIDIAHYNYSGGVYFGAPFKEVGVGYDSLGNLLTVFCDSVASGSGTLKCNKYSATDYQYLETYILQTNSKVHSGTVGKGLHPVAVWSDSQRIYASAFYDTMWSTIPTLISDSSLTNCINPDVVVENDSTMWVCYESNNEIYVTKTSVPLGITGGKPEPSKTTLKPFIHAYPNPASHRVNISYNNNRPAVISIYDITGGRIRSLSANNGQAVWDCRNGQGIQVSSGVYFIRARQDNNEIIKKINIVR